MLPRVGTGAAALLAGAARATSRQGWCVIKGGTKFYRGSARAARDYVEAGRSRADDYYLAEGTGFAERFSATADGQVRAMPQMDGDGYEAWVSGVDPDTGETRGRVRQDEHALRFAEVVVNGPKSWSIAAELHPDIAVAYGAAQDRAAIEIVRWMAQNVTTRVGPRGAQVATAVERLEAVAVQHHTSRAGDPHRHIHVQINARVEAAGRWRGIDSVAVRNSIGAVQGIGHLAVMADPAFRDALAAHGFTLDLDTGEVVELVGYVEPFSKRASQVAGHVERYEAQWRAANPDREPGPARWRSWDARAWVENRPGKAHVEAGQVLHDRWLDELAGLGYQPPTRPTPIVATRVGQIDRVEAAAEVLARLTASRSAWNQADLRGEAERLLARRCVVVEPEVRAELAEDITARAAAAAVPLLKRADVPTHIRAWTSAEAIAVEQDLTGRLAARGAAGAVVGHDAGADQVAAAAAAAGVGLDPAQAEAAAALAGDHPLVLVTGAAGAGKTTTLATTRAAVEHDGQQLLVITPTLKAARGARAETGAHTGTVAWLVFQHGWRQDDAGRWTRLAVGDVDTARWARGTVYQGPREDAQLRPGDLVVVDEAGMLDQDTARALLVVADEQHARVALVGDPHQLPAIGRGGVLDIANRWAERACTLDVIHRFTRTREIEPGVLATVEDLDYAALSLRMRDGAAGDPAAVFNDLAARGHVRTHASQEQLRTSVAKEAATARRAGCGVAVSVATNDQAHALNAAIREQLVTTGDVDDGNTGGNVVTTSAGQRVGTGDLIATRGNDRDADVANRDTWTVTAVHADGALTVAATAGSGLAGDRTLPPGYVNRHVELGYATTIHGVQGQTAAAGHLVLDEHTGAAAAYVGMTRGRTANTVHLVAADLDDARAQWIDAVGRGRPDLGIDAARQQAELAASQYATPSPRQVPADPARLAQVLDQLRRGWTEQARAGEQLARLEPRLARAQADASRQEQNERVLAPLREQMHTTRSAADAAEQQAAAARSRLEQRAEQIQASLQANWDTDRPVAAEAARTVQAGAGRLGRLTGGRANVQDAEQLLSQWAEKWRPVTPELTDSAAAARFAGRHPGNDRIAEALDDYARHRAAQELPEQVQLVRAAEPARQNAENAAHTYDQSSGPLRQRQAVLHAHSGYRDLANQLPHLTEQTTTARARLEVADRRVEQLTADPAITAHENPAEFLTAAHTSWNSDYSATQAAALQQSRQAAARQAQEAARQRWDDAELHYGPSHGPTTGRDGPSIGR